MRNPEIVTLPRLTPSVPAGGHRDKEGDDEIRANRPAGRLAAVLWAPAAWAADPVYLDLTPNLEKWFRPDGGKNLDLRLRTVNYGSFNGWVVHNRELRRDDTIVSRQIMLFSRNADGDVLYHGDPVAFVLEQPVTWVDAPLEVGKTWTASRPLVAADGKSTGMVHYVFAVLEEQLVACPMGEFPCHRVYVATVLPDGTNEACNFWYNPQCGLIRCVMGDQGTFLLQKAQVLDRLPPPDLDPDNPPTDADLSGPLGVPNPFNPSTEIRFDLGRELPVTVEIYDVAGRLVRRLLQADVRAQGPHAVPWDGRDDTGRNAASGTYVARIRAGALEAGVSLVLVR